MRLSDWLDNRYLKNIDALSFQFINNRPFEHLSLEKFFKEERVEKLLKALNNLEYYEESHDLYTFFRTIDFKNIVNKDIIEFREFIFSKEFIEFIQKLTKTLNLRTKGDLHSLKLVDTNYLLCHDDKVENRKLAFVLNLTKNWSKDKGGALELFSSKNKKPFEIEKSILPNFNQFNIFLVSQKSFHQISEVISKNSRLSISGWYYEN